MCFMMALAVLAGLSTAVMAAEAIPDSRALDRNFQVRGLRQQRVSSRHAEALLTCRGSASKPTPSTSRARMAACCGAGHGQRQPRDSEPLALAILADGKTVVGSDDDGSHFITIVSPDRLERCYTHNGSGPTGSIVASCGYLERVKK